MRKPVIIFIICLFAFMHPMLAQDRLTDSAFFVNAFSAARSQYMKNIGAGSYLYNGVAFEKYWNRIVGHPFFMSEFQQGSLYYDGTFYEDVPLIYDISRDQLVSKNFSKNNDVILLTEKLRSFTIGSNKFVKIDVDSSNTSLAGGFYESLYEGSYTVLSKHKKEILHTTKGEEDITKFKQYDYYYVEKDGKYYSIDGESSLLFLLKDQRSEMRKFMNRKEINFKKDAAGTIVQAIQYYEKLKK